MDAEALVGEPQMKTFSGGGLGGGGGRNDPDSYFSDDVVEVVLGISEGPIKGLKDNTAKNFYVGETPLLNIDGKPNFSDFDLDVHKGSSLGELIVPRLGGQSSNLPVNTQLSRNVPVVRQGAQRNIDWLELRFVIQSLMAETKSGVRARDLEIKIEYKPSDEATWRPGILYAENGVSVEDLGNTLKVVSRGAQEIAHAFSRKQVVYFQNTQPSPPAAEQGLGNHRVWWFNPSAGDWIPRYYKDGNFVVPNGLVVTLSPLGFENVSFEDPEYVALVDPKRADKRRRIFFAATGSPQPARVGDLWCNMSGTRRLWWNGSAWVPLLAPNSTYNPSTGEAALATDGILRIKDKISSNAVREVKVKVARAEVAYDIRVTKLSQDTSELTDQRTDVSLESIQEVKAEPMRFPGLATVHLIGRATDQFSSLPQFSGIYEGRVVKVPSNYNPVTRTYGGTWDGTWKLAYTNNPAFIGNDLVENDRYGMNSTYPVVLEPMDVYLAGVWCDIRIPSTTRPQFTFNSLIQEPQTARELATYIFGIFGGRFFDDGNGYARLRIDNDTNAVHLFAKENVKDGVFKYSYTEIESRKNDYTVSFKNPELFYREDRRRVFNQPLIDTYGRSPEEFVAVGCNNADEAIYRATVKLLSDQTEYETVTFETAREGLYLELYDIILVSDDTMDEVITGRIVSATANTVTLRDNVYLEAGLTHQLVINRDDFEIVTLNIHGGSTGVTTKTLQLTSDLPTGFIPEQAVFSIGKAAKPYRVMSIEEAQNDESEESITITALQVNRTKYADAAENPGGVVIEVPRFNTNLAAVTNPRITPVTEVRHGRVVQNLRVEWDVHPNKFVRSYIIASRFNEDGWTYHGDIRKASFELADVRQGRYVFSIQAVALTGQKSAIAYADIDLGGSVRPVPAVTDLVLLNEIGVQGTTHLFEEANARFQWNKGEPNPALSSYKIEIYNNVDQLRRTAFVGLPEYVYRRSDMMVDQATRQNKIVVQAVDLNGNESAPTALIFKNPAPAAPAVHATDGFSTVQFDWSIEAVTDYVGSLVWVSHIPGIDPASRPADYDLVGNRLSLSVGPNEYRYVRVALYDAMGKIELNYSAEVFARSYPVVDIEAPAVPTGLELGSVVITEEPGYVLLKATWDANSEADLAYYDIQVKEGAANYVSFQTSATEHTWRVRPGLDFIAKIRAVDHMGNASAFSALVEHTTVTDTEPPAVPTGLVASAGIDAIWLKWNLNTEPDYSHAEVYENTVDNSATATRIASAMGSSFARNSLPLASTRYYWLKAVDTSGNASEFTAVASGTTGTVPEPLKVTISGITFTPNGGAPNRVSWTGGEISYGPGGGAATTQTISAGFNNWTSGTVYIYYVPGNTALSSTAVLATMYASSGVLIGIYKGGTDFQLVEGKAMIDGGMILAQTIGANQLVTNQAVITGSAQIANAIIGNAHITELSATKIEANTALASSITVSGRALGNVSASDVAVDDMTASNWVASPGVANDGSWSYLTNPNSTASGSRFLRANTDGQVWLHSIDKIPFDPSKLYKVTFRIRRPGVLGNSSLIYLGVRAWAADGVSGVPLNGTVDPNIPANCNLVSAVAPSSLNTAWAELSGYLKGAASPGVSATGSSIAQAAKLHTSARFVSAFVVFNFNAVSGGTTIDFDSVKIEVVNEDAAEIVNAGTTTIEPGKIRISGPTTLSNWIKGGDETRIDGGMISANTIKANALEIGSRNLTLEGVVFEHNSPAAQRASWTAGSVRYINDAGATVSANITAGSTPVWAGGVQYIYWTKGATTFSVTTAAATAFAVDNVVMATYRGGVDLDPDYGRTIVDGSTIKTGTVRAAQIAANAILADAIATNAIEARHVQANSINASKMLLTDFSNMILDGVSLKDPSAWGFGGANVTWSLSNNIAPNAETVTARMIRSDGNGSAGHAANEYLGQCNVSEVVAVEPGKEYFFSWKRRSLSNAAGRFGFYASIYDKDLTLISNLPVGDAYAPFVNVFSESRMVTMPANAAFCRPYIRRGASAAGTNSGWIAAWDLIMRKAAGGELIVDGTITVGHVADNTITNAKIAAGAVSATELATNAVTGVKIADGAIVASKIGVNQITAGHINVANLSSISANVGVLTAGVLRSADSNFVIDLTNGYIEVKY